jgi:1-acyl-sn-glycerol-3-phosphate acyltransferase
VNAADLPDSGWPVMQDTARWIGRWLFPPVFRLHHHHTDRVPLEGPVVLVANHSSLVDAPLLFGVLRRRVVFLVKYELFRGPLGWALTRMGQIPVRRGEVDRAPLVTAQAVLRGGGLVAVFPEGTRGTGESSAARNGAAWLARTCDAQVLPVVCRGTYRPPGSPRRFRPRVDVLVGEPFRVSAARGRAGLAEATEQIRVALADLVTELDGLRDGPAGTTREAS